MHNSRLSLQTIDFEDRKALKEKSMLNLSLLQLKRHPIKFRPHLMKKKSTSQSVFLNVRMLIGLFICLAFLLGLGVFSNASAKVNSDPVSAQWNPLVWLEQKVTASDGTANSYFGSAAALNGSTALIGADGDNSFQGAAYLFTQSNGSWSEGQKLTASDALRGDEFGSRVALADNTLLVGAFTTTVGGVVSQGAAYVFTE